MKHKMRFTGIMILMIILVSGMVTLAFAEGQVPKAVAESDSYDFGMVAEGKTVKADFAIKNTGNADLVIKEVKTG